MALFKNIRLVFIFILLLVVPSLVMAISWTAMPGLGSGQYNSVAVEDFNKDGYKDIAGVKGDTASVWQQSLRWVCPASLYSWSFTGTDNGPSFSATYNAIAAGDIGSGPGNNPNLKPDGMPDTVAATTGGIYIFYGNSLDTWNSTPPVKGANTGYGRMSGVGTNSNTPADNWTVQCTVPRAVTTNLPQSTPNGGNLNSATLPYPNLLNQGDTYRFTFSNLSTASGVNPKKAFIVTKEELPVGEGRVDQSFTTLDSKISISPANWSSTSSILPDETIDLTINSVTPAAFSVNDSTPLLGEHSDATADVAYSDVIGGTGLSFTVSEDKNAGFIAGDNFTFTTYDVSDNLITGSATDVVSLRLADVDNDGELEIVAGTQSGIEVYDYNGAAWTTMNTNLPAIGEWRGIAVRDMDRDGNMDIVAASTTAGFIKAWYGDGAGLWTVADDLTTSSAIYYSLDVEDVSRDGIYDIIAGVGDSGIEVWLGDSNGDFSQGRKPTGTDRYYDVKIADINYDYKPDIIGAQWGGGIPVWLGDGTGEWWLSETEPIETGDYRAIAVTDMNNDGLPDVAGASYGGGVDVFLQSRVVDPSINWAKSSFPTASGDFQGTAVGDFNRDGNQDIVVAGNASGVRVFYGNGKTKVQSSSYIYNGYTGTGNGTIEILGTDDTKTNTEAWEVTCVTGGANPVFEVSRNGVPEAALYSLPGTYTHSGTGVSFVIYPGTTNFAVNDAFTFRTIEGGITSSGIYYGLITADFNNDGILDVAAASNGGGGIDIWYGNGEGEWDSVPPADGSWDGNAESENIGSGNYYYLAAGDINNDGKLDIVAGSDATGVHVFLNGWDGSTTGWTHNASPPQDPVSTGSYSGVALSDFDNDGNLDIAAASRGGDGVMVWLGNGDGSFNATNTGPDFASSVILTDEYGMGRTMTYYYDGIAAADFDRDGNMDIVAGNLGNFGVQVFYGDGDKLRHGHVTWNLSNVTPPVPSCGSSGNIYVQDLAASSYGQSYYGEYGSFGKDIYISGTKVRVGVATSDYVTGDSDVTLTAHQPTEDEPWDFIDSCSGGGISIDFPSSGCSNGLILRGTSYSYDPQDLLYFSTYNPGVTTSGQYYGVATEDFNKDGYPDVVAANKNNGGIQVWLNGGSKSFYRVPESSESISSVWTSTTDPVVNGNYKGVAVVDFNKDGNMDIVGAHDFTGGTGAEVWLNSVDLIPPTVVPESLSPASDATDVSTGASISAQFSEDIDILTLRNNDTTGTFSPSSDSTIMVYGSKSGYHSGVINYDSTTFTVTFYPDAPFTTTEIVTVTFSSKIADSAGNHLDGNGDGTGSDTPSDYFLWSFTVVDTVKPLPPTAVTGTPGEGKAILSWTAPVKNEDNSTLTDLAGFNVYRGNVSGGPYFKINSTAVSSSVTTYTNSPLTNGATYYYVITAVDQYGNESVNSTPQVSVTPALDTVKPSPPESFAAVAGNQKVTLTWTAPATNDDDNDDVVDDADDVSTLTDLAGYWVYRGTAPGVYGSGPINSVLIPAGTVEYIDTTATNGTTYYYAVTAEDSSISTNESGYSTEGSAAPYNDVTAPRAPSSVTATGGAAEITLSWTAPTENEDSSAISEFNSYKIYRHLASFTDVTDTGVTLIATITDYSVTSWKDTASNGLVIDTTYYYRVTSTDTNGNESATPSNQVSAAPLNPVGALGLYSSDYTIPADGVAQATITAIAQSPLGYPVADGTTINFSVSCSASECGTLSASSVPTTGGQASVTITSTTILTNTVTITASSGTVSGSTTIAFKPGPPDSANITFSASPAAIPADGISTSTITATIKDSGLNLVKDGLYVTFTTDLGTFPNGTTTSDPVATSGGAATVSLESGATGTPTITATVGSATNSGTPLTITSVPAQITASASPSTIAADGATTSAITAYVDCSNDSVNNCAIGNGVVINFTTTSGTLSASSAAIAGSAGQASVNLTSTSSNGSATVTASWTNGTTTVSNTTTVTFSSGLPSTVTVTSDKTKVAADDTQTTTISATVKDSAGNNVNDGMTVSFAITSGTGTISAASATTTGGVASVTLKSGIQGSVTVTATAATGTGSGTATVSFVEPPAQVVLTSNITWLDTGSYETTVTALIYDQYGRFVEDGLTVYFNTDSGTLKESSALISNGEASVEIQTYGISPMTISANCEGITGTINIYWLQSDLRPAMITVSGDPINVPVVVNSDGWLSFAKIKVVLVDQFDNPVPINTPVTITTTAGALFEEEQSQIPSVHTKEITLFTGSGENGGTVEAYLYSHDIYTRTSAVVTATSYGVTGSTTINFRPGPPEDITFTASPAAIASDGLSTSSITIKVRDAIAGGRSTALAALILTDNTRSWTVNAFKGMKLNPDTTQSTTYTIASNTATTITVTAGDMTTVASSGKTYKVSATGTSTGITSTVLTDSTASWTVDALIGLNLNPNTSQGQVFEITDNDATTITVKTNGLNTVATAGNTYEIAGDYVKDGQSVTFTTDKGSFLNGTQTSDPTTTSSGIATVAIKSSTTSGDVPVITAILGRLEQEAKPVTFDVNGESVGVPKLVAVWSSDLTIPADGTSQATITALVLDQYGYLVADGLNVTFSTTSGTLSAATGTTSGGMVSVTITSTTALTNSVTITATCEGVSGNTTIEFNPGPPSMIGISASPSSIYANGADTTTITATITDSGGNTVKDGLYIILTTTLGTFSSGTQTSNPIATLDGQVSTVLMAGVTIGEAIITAKSGLLSVDYGNGVVGDATPGLTLTIDNIVPTISSVSPADNNSGVAINTNITAVFSEGMNSSTLTSSTITVSASLSGSIAGVISYNSSTKTITFDPASDLPEGETITVTITTGAKDLAGNAIASNYVWDFSTTESTPPAVPTGLTATAGNTEATLSWTANTESDLNEYYIYRSTTSGGPYSKVSSSSASGTSYTDSSLTNGTTYYYVITAVDTIGNESSYSSEVSVVPSETAPAAPTGLAASAGDQSVSLSWTANTETDLQGYNVYRSTTSGSGYAVVNSTVLTSASYTDTGLTNGTTYYYVITAVDTASLESSYSSEVSDMPYSPGDADRDGVVNGDDLIIFGSAFGSQTGDANWNANVDFDDNGVIDAGDLVILGRYFGRGETW